MSGQLGFWDVSDRLSQLSKQGDPLEKLAATVDFEMFRPELMKASPRGELEALRPTLPIRLVRAFSLPVTMPGPCSRLTDRPFGGDDPPAVAYIYAPDRKALRPAEHLQGFRGILQVDGYGGYKALAEKGQVRLAFCWAHVRRRFYELAANGHAPIATEALKRIAALYQVETTICGRSPDERRKVRQETSLPLLDALEVFLREKLTLISQSEAVNADRGL